jgi:phenylpropionate dioxygenase-like ring-hydroxylating dioxygenase large terminal subunit
VGYGEDLALVGAGTLMGDLMRQYWIPAAMSNELSADGDPLRLVLLGERLVAFRDSDGRVGVMDHRCPHRCASLFMGRNEEGGLRCVYHGWKFTVDGTCVDMPNVAPGARFDVSAKAYPVEERNGLIWVYLGPRAAPPPLPQLEANLLSAVNVQFVMRSCNWLQALEGDIDTSHFGFLHAGHITQDMLNPDSALYHTVGNRAPDYHVTDTPWGTQYGAYRPAGEGQTYWRFANFLFPFYTQQPQGPFPKHVHFRAWVPLDDTHTMFINVQWKDTPRAVEQVTRDGRPISGMKLEHVYLPNTTDWFGRWRLAANEANDWQIDRTAQRNGEIFTGIADIHLQDQAVTESMGPITDFSSEHLTPSDQMIARTRRRVLGAAKALREHGTIPPGVDDPDLYLRSRSGFLIADDAVDWQDAYAANLAKAVRPAGVA